MNEETQGVKAAAGWPKWVTWWLGVLLVLAVAWDALETRKMRQRVEENNHILRGRDPLFAELKHEHQEGQRLVGEVKTLVEQRCR